MADPATPDPATTSAARRTPEQPVLPGTEATPAPAPVAPATPATSAGNGSAADDSARIEAEVQRRIAAEKQAAADRAERARVEAEAAANAAKLVEQVSKTGTLEADAAQAKVERDIAVSILATGEQLQNASALEFLNYEAGKLIRSGKPAAEAIKTVLDSHAYLRKAPVPPVAESTSNAASAAPVTTTPATPVAGSPATTVPPAASSGTATAPVVTTPEVVDATAMNPQEYQKYRRSKGL